MMDIMGNGIRIKPGWTVIWAMAWLFVACVPSSSDPLPTLAVAANMPDGVGLETAVAASSDENVPATWTPLPPGATQDLAQNFGQFSPPGPTVPPTETPIIPTRTPRPTPTSPPTPTPEATPTTYVSNIPDLQPSTELGQSKLGLHIIRNNDAYIMEFIRQGQPAVIKALDDFGYLAQVKAVSPRTIIVGRKNFDHQDYQGVPEESARIFVAQQLDQYLANPAVDYWEGWNEPDPNLNNMPWYTRFEQERVRLLAQHGLKAAIGGFPTGVPELNEFALFLPAIETAIQYNGILTLHEYNAPDLTYLYGDPLPGYPAYPDRGSLTFRYRWFYRELLEPAGLVIPLVISEAGIDGILGNRPGPDGAGWSYFQNYWVEQGWGANGVEAFINQLAWYDNGVRRDGYVIGFALFTAGGFRYWEKYNINPILPDLTAYVVSQR